MLEVASIDERAELAARRNARAEQHAARRTVRADDGPPPDEPGYLDALARDEPAPRAAPAPVAAPRHESLTMAEAAPDGVDLIRGSDLRLEPVAWLWPGWLAKGKLHILGGAPGTGKTTLAMALAATVTTGGRFPDGTRAPVGNVVIWSGEDDPADTLAPRLVAAGADMGRVLFVGDVAAGADRRPFDPSRDTEALARRLVEAGGASLLIVDPIVSAIAGDSHKNAEVRRGLQPLVDLAGRAGCALLGITHFSKGTGGREPVDRLTGSLAFGAVARVVLVAAKRREGEAEDGAPSRLLVKAKSNISAGDGGFTYDLQQTELDRHPGIAASFVAWGPAVEGTARELLAVAEADTGAGGTGDLAEARQFLADLLAAGPVPANDVKRKAAGAGLSWTTVRRGKDVMGIKSRKQGLAAGWAWSLPEHRPPDDGAEPPKMLNKSEDAQQKNMSTFGKNEHLRAESPAPCPRCDGEGCRFCRPARP